MVIETYNIARKSEFLVGVHHEFGKINLQPITTTPSVIWYPIDEEIIGSQFVQEDLIIDGKSYQKDEIARRKSNFNIYLFEKNYESLELLINRVANGISEAGNYTWQNISLESGEFLDRESVAENTVGYVFKAYVIVPLYRLTLQDIITTGKSAILPTGV